MIMDVRAYNTPGFMQASHVDLVKYSAIKLDRFIMMQT